MDAFEFQELQTLIGFQLLLNKATDADKAKGKEQFEKTLRQLKENSKLSDDEFNEKLNLQAKMQGLTREQWNQKSLEQTIVPAVLERELKVNVTDEDVKKYYEEHPSLFEEPEMARASQILLRTSDSNTGPLTDEKKQAKRKQMGDLLKRARAGEDFAKLAGEYSEVPGAKQDGGELLPFPRGMMPDVPEFEAAAFSLTNNQISDIVTTTYGFHIIKLNERMPARTAALEDEVIFGPQRYILIKKYWNGPPETVRLAAKLSLIIRQNLEVKQREEQIPDYMAKLQKEADIQILDERLKPRADARTAPGQPAKPEKPAEPKAGEAK
jgi:parvulin-like peptidyl-prolyl isomerase